MGRITACASCKDREPGCHAVCDAYLEERADLDERNRRIRKAKAPGWEADAVMFRKGRTKRGQK